ncbi:DinB family protein [Aquimarina sp. MMG016]|uniref:DinB family protein n=1 Tax=Aquimarina sp. MMG016 TaxID=2822690 RepID=UPI001B3A3B01|nr:DinB family protein [Aquimarina sp. MMG016]MBQ4821847.1 DinB family protein [Aquimarina sp. MMG016]
MERTKQIADRFREVILDGKWVVNTNYKDQIVNLSWKQATKKVGSLNTIAALTFHINYYIAGVLNVLEGGALEIRDKYSFDMSPITSQEDWEKLCGTLMSNSEKFADLVESLPDKKLDEVFVDPKYGSYERNIEAMIEHSYYHLGQISLIHKMLLETD